MPVWHQFLCLYQRIFVKSTRAIKLLRASDVSHMRLFATANGIPLCANYLR